MLNLFQELSNDEKKIDTKDVMGRRYIAQIKTLTYRIKLIKLIQTLSGIALFSNLLTKHKKEHIIAPKFLKMLNAEVIHTDAFDTDELGPRLLTVFHPGGIEGAANDVISDSG